MSIPGLFQIVIYVALILLLTKPVGLYLKRVFDGERTVLSPVIAPIERAIYRITGVKPAQEQGWKTYAACTLLFAGFGSLSVYLILRLQPNLPWNPQDLPAVSQDLAFNTAVSFVSNTNWQAYAGENTMAYFSQMAGLAVQNFLSAATGIAISVALIRGLARRSAQTIGNFWVDVVRGTLYVLLPMSLVLALVLVWQGVPQNLNSYATATTMEGAPQVIPQGPVASQEAIKMLGTNGGGFFNANSAHPYENPNPLTNFLEMLAILVIPAGLTYTFGRSVGNTRQGWVLWSAMIILLVAGLAISLPVEQQGNPLVATIGIDQQQSALQSGGNFEGKEVRFGMSGSMLFTSVTTAASCGAVNNMHDSLLPLSGMVPLLNIQLGEVIFGGVGAGLLGIVVFAILAVFIAGLMVGRTPEYLGKKIEPYEMKMAMLAILVLGASILLFSGLSSVTASGTEGILNDGPHGLSEILYAYSSGTGNNGSAFGGLSANTDFYNLTTGVAMLIGRFLMIVPILAIAGSMARKGHVPASLGTFPTDGPLFTGLLVAVVLMVGALTYFPALALGPIVEHILLGAGQLF